MRKYLPLAAVAAALLALAGIAAMLLVNRDTQPAAAVTTPAASASPTPTLSGTDAGPATDGSTANADEGTLTAEELQSQWEPVVTAFAKAFTNTTGGHKAWLARLTTDSQLTDAVAKALDTVDTANVPAGKLESVTLVTSDQYTASAKVTYDTGWSMIVTVNTDGIDWAIASYDSLDEG